MLKNMKNQCGKIGIDCEWCDNKDKCLHKSFYKDVLYNKLTEDSYEYHLNEIVRLFSEKIDSHKDYIITVLPQTGPNSQKHIHIQLKYDFPETIYKLKDKCVDGYLWETTLEKSDCLTQLVKDIKQKIKEKYEFSFITIKAIKYKYPFDNKILNLYFLP